jgi:hypothetical protein
MTISKLSSVLCALAVGATCFTIRAEDNPAQAAARIALAKQLFEENGQQSTNAPVPNAPSVPEATTSQASAQAAADAQARQAADRKLADQQAAQAAAAAKLAKAQAKAQKEAAAAKAKTDKAAAAKAKQAAADAKARQTADQKLAGQPTTAAAANSGAKARAAAPASQTMAAPQPAPVNWNNYEGADSLKPIAAPALPISASKADRLAALLSKYKADQLTPEEYHQQRAAILAEP